MKKIMIFTDDDGHSNAYDISTQFNQDVIFGDIIRQLGGYKGEVAGMDTDSAVQHIEEKYGFHFGRGGRAAITTLKNNFDQFVD